VKRILVWVFLILLMPVSFDTVVSWLNRVL